MTTHKSDAIGNRLLWWLKTLPNEMQYFCLSFPQQPTSDNLMLRQLFVIYFATVTILYRTDWPTQVVHPQAIIASAFMACLLEGFIARDEIQRLPTMFGFYAISAAIPQMVAARFHKLKASAENDLSIILQSLTKLSARWPSSDTVLRYFRTLKHSETSNNNPQISPETVQHEDLLLFDNFDFSSCRTGSLLVAHDEQGYPKSSAPYDLDGRLSATGSVPELGLHHGIISGNSSSLRMSPLPWDRNEQLDSANNLNIDDFADFPDMMGDWLVFGNHDAHEIGLGSESDHYYT